MAWLYGILQRLVQNGPGITPVIAIAAGSVAWGQLRLNRGNQRETIAKTLYRDYLRLAIDKPRFAYPGLMQVDHDRRTADSSNDAYEAYEWFVSYLLHALEEILTIRRSEVWIETVKAQLGYHKPCLSGEYFQTELKKCYSWALQELIDGVCAVILTSGGTEANGGR